MCLTRDLIRCNETTLKEVRQRIRLNEKLGNSFLLGIDRKQELRLINEINSLKEGLKKR